MVVVSLNGVYQISRGDVITCSGSILPMGVALNNANKGESVFMNLNESTAIKSTESKEYKIPTINLEVRKIELDR